MESEHKIAALRRQGVEIFAPGSVEIGDEVKLEQIRGPGTVIHAGTRLHGAGLSIGPGCRLGHEEPVTVDGCALGPRVELRGGYFADSVFLDGVVMGQGAQVRAGTLLEEQASGAHTVGLKQTVLLPFVTLGSLINFCDILMAGGSSRRDHSEVGSSFIHFNFTPFGANGDKATPSLVGDVPRGVMLREQRIFLGGQGGLVGPVSIDYGTVLAAGFVYRLDHGPDELVVGEKLVPRTLSFDPRRYSRIRAKVERNLRYIGNLAALWHWYETVRTRCAAGDAERTQLHGRARDLLRGGIGERVKRLGQIAGYMEPSIAVLEAEGTRGAEIAAQRAFADGWPRMERALLDVASLEPREGAQQRAVLERGVDAALQQAGEGGYLAVIRGLSTEAQEAGTRWLQAIVDHTIALGRPSS